MIPLTRLLPAGRGPHICNLGYHRTGRLATTAQDAIPGSHVQSETRSTSSSISISLDSLCKSRRYI